MKPTRTNFKSKIKDQAGLIVADFIFSIVLASGLGIILFSMSYTLAVVEVTQYVSFATARAGMAGNKSADEQEKKARAKYTQLITGKGAVGTLYGTAWFTAGSPDKLDVRQGPTGNGAMFSDDLAGGNDRRNWFMGVSVPLTVGILKFNLPLIGDTAPDSDNGLETSLNAMLIRDPSEKECKDFMEQRRQALKQLPSGAQFYEPASYIGLEDNGC
jgi:hypothetical protein